jgi:hypothetical protein
MRLSISDFVNFFKESASFSLYGSKSWDKTRMCSTISLI